jgi:TP901-1 family phage major tail protein
MSKKGIDILVLANTGTTELPAFEVVGGQRGATLSEENETFETTNKVSGKAREFEYGFYQWSISADGVHVKDDTAYKKLVDAVRNQEKVIIQWKEGTEVIQGLALVTSRELEGPYDGEATYSLEFQGTGELSTPQA